jgi:general secretion pathway protein H
VIEVACRHQARLSLLPRQQRSDREGMQGISLLEMLLVIALMASVGIIAAMTMSGGREGMQLRGAAKTIAAQLRYTRTQAIVTGTPKQFSIDPVSRRWQAANGREGELPASLAVRFYGAREVQPQPGTGGVRFFADGASSGGRIQLRAADTGLQVEVAWLTGEVVLAALPEAAP